MAIPILNKSLILKKKHMVPHMLAMMVMFPQVHELQVTHQWQTLKGNQKSKGMHFMGICLLTAL